MFARLRELITSNRGLLKAKADAIRNVPTLKAAAALSTIDGYARTDAFGVGRNELFGLTAMNGLPSDAPVSFPHTWGMQHTAWLQWGANTNSVMERNIGQALGVGAVFDPVTFRSSVRLENLHRMEQLTYKLTAPAWPASFPPVDQAKADRGKTLLRRDTARRATRPGRPTATCASTSCSRCTRSAPIRRRRSSSRSRSGWPAATCCHFRTPR